MNKEELLRILEEARQYIIDTAEAVASQLPVGSPQRQEWAARYADLQERIRRAVDDGEIG